MRRFSWRSHTPYPQDGYWFRDFLAAFPVVSPRRKACPLWGGHYAWLLCWLLSVVLLPMSAAWGQATATVTAVTGESCAGTRLGSDGNCTANDLTNSVTLTQDALTAISTCVAGSTLNLNLLATINSGGANRFDVALFTGENGNDPSLNDATKSCSIALFPTSPTPFFTTDADVCGDFSRNSTAVLQVNNIKLQCLPAPNSNKLVLPGTLAWSNNNNGSTCTVTNVQPETGSKCRTSLVNTITGVVVQGYVNLTKQTTPTADPQSFSFTSTTASGATPTWTLAGTATSQTLVDNQTKQISVPLLATGTETLTITETLAALWESGVTITCTAGAGSGNPVTVNNTTRTITANLTSTNFGADCTITNTKRSTITLVKNVGGRVTSSDQFTLTATGGGTLQDTLGNTLTAPVTVTTTGTATTAQTTFTSQPGQTLTMTETAASGTLGDYTTLYACSNATAGSATVLPSGSTTTFTLTPAAGDDITCTYTNTPKPRLSLSKVIIGGRAASTDQFTLSITPGSGSNSFTTTGAGTAVGGGPATLVGSSGVTYTLSEVAASGSLANYTVNYACTNTGTGGTTVTAGTGTSFTVTPVNNDVLACTFTNTNPTSPGYVITGQVFQDNGAPYPVGTGTNTGLPNNGIRDGNEVGIPGVTVRLTNCSGTVYSTTTSDGSGNYTLAADTAPPGAVCVEETNLAGYISTGANTTVGTYDRATDTIHFTLVASTNYSGVNFGDVPVNIFDTDGNKTALPGTTVTYPHTFLAGSGGTVSFHLPGATASPVVPGWSEVLYTDSNCNGMLDSGESATSTAPITVLAGTRICLIQKEFVPAAAPQGATNLAPVQATFVYTGAALPALTASDTRQDFTRVSDVTLGLQKLVRNITTGSVWLSGNSAQPGEILEYQITYTNNGPAPISALQVYDVTPAFTTFVAASADTSLPPSITSCTKTTPTAMTAIACGAADAPGGVGGIVWNFTGPLAPGASGKVTFRVKLD